MTKLDIEKPKRARVQTAARTIQLLTEVAVAAPSGISAKDISDRMHLPRQVIYHLLHTLCDVGAIRKVSGSKYALGLGLASIAEGFRQQLGSIDIVAKYAQMAASISGETTYVVSWVDNEIVVLCSSRGASAIAAAETPPGIVGFAHARASGKLLLSHLSPELLNEYIARHPLEARTLNTIASRSALDLQLAQAREERVAYDIEEYSLGLSCIAVPLGSSPKVRMVLGLSAPSARFNENLAKYRDALLSISDLGTSSL